MIYNMLDYMGSMTLELNYNIFDRFRILEVELSRKLRTRKDPFLITYSRVISNSIFRVDFMVILTKSWRQAHG